MEAEVVPLFFGGIFLVILFEVIFSILVLRKYPEVKRAMIGHVACLLIAFLCVGIMFFGPQFEPDGVPVNHSGQFGLAGIFWFISECCGIAAVKNALFSGKQQNAKKESHSGIKIKKL